MRVILDIECDGLNPHSIWLIVCKDIDTQKYHIFRRVTDDATVSEEFRQFAKGLTTIVGHNALGYDIPVVDNLLGMDLHHRSDLVVVDTLIVSKLVDYSRKGHSIEDYGLQFGIPKGDFTDFSQYSEEMETYCVRDVDITERVYFHYLSVIDDPAWTQSIRAEHSFQLVVNDLHNNGFCFNVSGANNLLAKVNKELHKLDEAIHASFPPRSKLIREINPTYTLHGTLHRKDFRWVQDGDLSYFNGGPFSRFKWEDFNPASHRQVVNVLHDAGWRPVDRTAGAIETRRKINRLVRENCGNVEITLDNELKALYDKEQSEEKYGWKINETNLSTLPPTAPSSAKSLARRILVESRRRVLVEWLSLCQPDGRIHGKFYSIGAWTHRMAHQAPNTANIPNSTDTQGKTRLYGGEMRSLWCAPPGRHLVGVDAEGIQLRIFAHYINDSEFTKSIVEGRKDDKTDPHSLNKRILGSVCKNRAAAKRFVFALLLGAGLGKLAEILDCTREQAQEALNNLLQRYQGFKTLKDTIIPADAARGYFIGLDGRRVPILGQTIGERKHLAMSGYLQNGEAVVMKHATLRWYGVLRERGIEFKLVNMVHDEWQTECPKDLNIALAIAYEQADSLRWVGEQLGLKCPLAGSYWNDDLKDYTIGDNWSRTH